MIKILILLLLASSLTQKLKTSAYLRASFSLTNVFSKVEICLGTLTNDKQIFSGGRS